MAKLPTQHLERITSKCYRQKVTCPEQREEA